MRPLSAEEILALWEAARNKTPVERAIAIWATSDPLQRGAALWDLSLIERDRALISLRRVMYGDVADCFLRCPECSAQLELSVNLAQISSAEPLDEPWMFESGDFRVRYRSPTSADLWAGLQSDEDTLLERCMVDGPRRLPPEIKAALAAAIEQRSSAADVRFRLECEACKAGFSAPFDIARYLWREIEIEGRRLLRDVDAIARAYGWSEREILQLSRQRRQAYLELVGGS